MVEPNFENVSIKQCFKCNKIKPIHEFTKNRSTRDGYAHICRECKNIRPNIDTTITDKVCKKCGVRKPLGDFHKNCGSKDGRVTICKQCFNRPRIINPNPIEKRCTKCRQVKPITEFNKDVKKGDGYRSACRLCDKLSVIKNKNKIKVNTKLCPKCGIKKPLDDFEKIRGNYHSHCKTCAEIIRSEVDIQFTGRHTNEDIETLRVLHPLRVCARCKKSKSIYDFAVRSYFKNGFDYFCNDCKKEDRRPEWERYKELSQDIQNEWRSQQHTYSKNHATRLKLEVFSHYTKDGIVRCANPYHIHNEDITNLVLLTLDHINGDGYKELDHTGKRLGGANFYSKLKRNNYPSGLQILCWNCQAYKAFINKEHHGVLALK